MTDCAICLETVNKSTRAPTTCPSCASVFCRACLQTSLLYDESIAPPCPSCKNPWSHTFLCDSLTQTFRTGPYKTHREKLLVDKEQARIPDTQEDARRYKDARVLLPPLEAERRRLVDALKHLPETAALAPIEAEYLRARNASAREASALGRRLNIAELEGSERATKRAFAQVRDTSQDGVATEAQGEDYRRVHKANGSLPEYHAWQTAKAALKTAQDAYDAGTKALATPLVPLRRAYAQAKRLETTARDTLQRQLREHMETLGEPKYLVAHFGVPPAGVAAGEATGEATGTVERRAFVMKCPQSTCQGFLSTQYKCGLCEVRVCAHCHVLKTEEHFCDPATVETIQQIRREARPCPSCTALISKVDGCDQMWCTQCRTAFSWNTGRVETTVVHNPHFFQYMRETGQAAPRRDNPGFGCAAVHNIGDTLHRLRWTCRLASDRKFLDTIVEDYRQVVDAREVHLGGLRRATADYGQEEWRRVLRVRRLVDEIDESTWKATLQRKEKENHKNTAWVQLLELYTTVAVETFARITRTSTLEEIQGIYDEFLRLKAYTLEQATAISKVFGCVVPACLRPPTPAPPAAVGTAVAVSTVTTVAVQTV